MLLSRFTSSMDPRVTRKLFSLRTSNPPAITERKSTAFHAVEIRCSADSCPAAHEQRGKRFLANEAPTLPLERCDRRSRCECHYRHFDDRRRGQRRSEDTGAPPPAQQRSVDERKSPGRRAEDQISAVDEASLLDDTYYDYIADKRRE
jgi:hypothetical protein